MQDLEALTPQSASMEPSNDKVGQGETQGIQVNEPTTEAFRASDAGAWATVHGKPQGT